LAQQGASAPAPLTKPELIAGLQDFERRFFDQQSFLVEFATDDGQILAKTIYGIRYALRAIVARRGLNLYTMRQSQAGVGGERIYENGKPKFREPVYSVYRGGIQVLHNGGYATVTSDDLSDIYECWRYTDNLYLNVYDSMDVIQRTLADPDIRHVAEQFTNQPFLPREVIDHESSYHVAPELQQVDGAWCHVLERPGADRIWIDPAQGFVVRRRELNWGPGLPRSRIVENREFRQVKPGLWLPWKQVITYFPNPKFESASVVGRPAFRQTLTVKRAEFDTLTDDFFKITIPAGVHVSDIVRGMTYYTQSATDEPFDQAIRFAASKTSRWGLYVGYLIGISAALLAALVFWNRLRMAR
jgi:hypothetical protein